MDDSMSFYENSGMRKCAGELIGDLRISTRKDDELVDYLFAENMIRRKRHVLDFGCGDGGFLLRAKEIAKYVEGGVNWKRKYADRSMKRGSFAKSPWQIQEI